MMQRAVTALPLHHVNTRRSYVLRAFTTSPSEELRIERRKLIVSSLVFASVELIATNGAECRVTSAAAVKEDKILKENLKRQAGNNAPEDFPAFIRTGFKVKVLTNDKYLTSSSGLIYLDIEEGKGEEPKEGQQVVFHYTGYNESGRKIDSSYQQNRPAKARIGFQTLVPGFEEGMKSMKVGGKRRIIVPPDLGPPVGPSTFFSAKQFEVFDIELLDIEDCTRRTIAFFSDVICN